MDVAPLADFTDAVASTVADVGPGPPRLDQSAKGPRTAIYPGETRVRTRALAACIETALKSEAMMGLPMVTGLHFVGLAKSAGLFDWVVTAQEIAVADDQGRRIVSRR